MEKKVEQPLHRPSCVAGVGALEGGTDGDCARLCVQASIAKRKKEVRPVDARRTAARMGRRTEALLGVLNTANTTAVMVGPCAVVHLTNAEPVPSFVIVVFTIVLWMKLVSFAHCNMDLRCDPHLLTA